MNHVQSVGEAYALEAEVGCTPCLHNPAGVRPACEICFPVLHSPSPAVPVRSLYDQWEADFKPLLGATGRWEGFSFIAKDQLEREQVAIIETGTCRKPGDWKGDGQSTRVWDWIVAKKEGFGYSVDLDIGAVVSSQQLAPHMQVVCQDSISFLRGHIPFKPTLLYLDSFDYPEDLTVRVNACMHQAAELGAIWGRLPSGCLIASDDSIDANNGKPAITRRILGALGIEPILDSYIVVWRKP